MSNIPGYQIIDQEFSELVDTSTPPEVIADGCKWAEGPVWVEDKLFFSDIPNKRMLSYSPKDGVDVALANSEFTNGNTLDLTEAMVSCVHGLRQVIRRPDVNNLEKYEVLASHYDDKKLNSPNDVVVSSDGSVWFTDPPYGIVSDYEGYQADSEIGSNNVYRLSTDKQLTIASADFDRPNGLAFSFDEKRLYIADSGAAPGFGQGEIDMNKPHNVRVADVVGTTLQNLRLFVDITPGVPDGIRVDTQDYVWITAFDGVQVYTPDAKLVGKILLPDPTANCCFGGPSGKELFITSSDKVYRVQTTRSCASTHNKMLTN